MNHEEFEFRKVSEEPESLDFNKLVNCPRCKKPIPHDATLCLYCGESVSSGKKSSWIFWTAIFVIVIFILLFIL